MTAPVSCPNAAQPLPTPRQRDRRQALSELLTALTRALEAQSDISLMRAVFEQMLRRLIPVRALHLRDAGARRHTRIDGATAAAPAATPTR